MHLHLSTSLFMHMSAYGLLFCGLSFVCMCSLLYTCALPQLSSYLPEVNLNFCCRVHSLCSLKFSTRWRLVVLLLFIWGTEKAKENYVFKQIWWSSMDSRQGSYFPAYCCFLYFTSSRHIHTLIQLFRDHRQSDPCFHHLDYYTLYLSSSVSYCTYSSWGETIPENLQFIRRLIMF